MCKKLNVSIFEIFKGTPLIYIKNTEEIDGMYNQLTYSNKKLIRDILEVIIKNQSTNINEDMKPSKKGYNKEADDYYNENLDKYLS